MKITFIRHGATVSNGEGRYLGWTDEPLSNDGKKQIIEKWGNTPQAEVIFCSPMKRCMETAQLIFGTREFIVIPEWKEMNFGKFEGKNYTELNGNPEYQEWIDSGGTLPFPEGESREEFIHRTMKGFSECIKICKKRGVQNVTCIVHGGTIMAILSSVTGEEYFKFQIKNGQACELCLPLER